MSLFSGLIFLVTLRLPAMALQPARAGNPISPVGPARDRKAMQVAGTFSWVASSDTIRPQGDQHDLEATPVRVSTDGIGRSLCFAEDRVRL